MNEKVLTIYEVRLYIRSILDTLEKVNAHIHDNSVCSGDYDALRRAWEEARKIMTAKWTNDLF